MATQWHDVFDDALRSTDVIAVWVTVAAYLGRTPTRAEITAARRAANSYAARSNVQVVHVAASVDGAKLRNYVLLARADADLDDGDRLADVAAGRANRPAPRGRGARNVPQRAESIVGAVAKAARSSHQVSVGQLDAAHAQDLAAELAPALHDLQEFHRRLRLLSQPT